MENRVFAGRYHVIEKVGTGGMAEVFKAHDATLNRVVAIKTMLPQYASDTTFAARFRQEAQAAAHLSSPYIVSIYDWGKDNDTYFIVMEYIPGVNLKAAIEQHGAINPHKVAEIGSQVCSALSVAHSYNIIHRDIKPHNIMIKPDGNAVVMDFGIARAGNSHLTQTDSVLGTAHYVSPEQAQGKTLTPASDLYSLGVVLYEAATGKLPFDAPDAVAVAMKQVSEQPMPPSVINPRIDPTLEAIILHAMEKKPENRFASADDMRAALNNYVAGRPVILTTPGFTSDQTAVLNGAPTVAMPVEAADHTAVMPNVPNRQAGNGQYYNYNNRPPEVETKKKSKAPVVAAIIAILAVLIVAGAIFGLNRCSSSSSGTTVPDIVGMTKSKAQTAITDSGFTVGNITEQSSDTVAIGYVISQSPKAGKNATSGTQVDFVVSTGPAQPAQTTVPDLSGMTASEAEAALSKANLIYAAGDSQYSSTVAVGKVAAQSVAAGTLVDQGTTVTYSISLGVEQVTVPDVTGMSQTTATNTLTNAGFQVDVETSYSSSVKQGVVISQNPTSGNHDKGSTVTITVSDGPEPVEQVAVPSLTGMSLSDAQNALNNVGLSYNIAGGDSTTTVKSTDPSSGTKVDVGSTVNLTFNSSVTPTTP